MLSETSTRRAVHSNAVREALLEKKKIEEILYDYRGSST